MITFFLTVWFSAGFISFVIAVLYSVLKEEYEFNIWDILVLPFVFVIHVLGGIVSLYFVFDYISKNGEV